MADSGFICATIVALFCGFLLGINVPQRTDIIACSNKGGLRDWTSEQAALSTEISNRNIARTIQVGRLILPSFYAYLDDVSYSNTICFSSKANSGLEQENGSFYKPAICMLTVWLMIAPPLIPTSSCQG